MTEDRARAYGRVIALADDADHVRADEGRQLREAADALLFAGVPDSETAQAVAEARAVLHGIVDSGRADIGLADEVLHALRECGPAGVPGCDAFVVRATTHRMLWWPPLHR
jgi:hypothetical protein